MFQSPGDVAFNFFGYPVYYYGIILASAIFVGIYCAYLLYKKYYEASKAQNIIDLSPWIIIIGILGARFYYCLVNFSYYTAHPFEIFYIRQGGLSVHGMIFVLLLVLFKRLSKTPGLVACIYLILYSFARILVESCRVDSVLNIAGIPIAQIMSLAIIIFASVFVIILIRKKN